MAQASIFSDFLSALGVPHTQEYSDGRFRTMTFRSLFGMSKLLQEYGIDNEALQVADKDAALSALVPPYIARLDDSFCIVTAVSPGQVSYSHGLSPEPVSISRSDFLSRWSGIVLAAYPDGNSREPRFAEHRFIEIANYAKRWILLAAAIFVFLYFFISNRLYVRPSTILLTLTTVAGLYVTYELMLKSLGIESRRGDSICGIIDRNGCRSVLDTPAAKFFGLFGWSEVGFAYFGVTLVWLLIFPGQIKWLALINACCCPFSFWSVWYQKYRAHAWCTLCLITQGCLWLSLACYIFGGWFARCLPPQLPFFVLAAVYIAALLTINTVDKLISRK